MGKPAQHTTTNKLYDVLDLMSAELENVHLSHLRNGLSISNDIDTTKVCFSNVLWEITKAIKDKNGETISIPKPMSQRLNLILTLLRIQLRLEKGLS